MNRIHYVMHWFGAWFDLYFSGIDPLMIQSGTVVNIDELRR